MNTSALLLLATLAPADPVAPFDGMTPPERAELVEDIRGEWVVVTFRINGKDFGCFAGERWTFTGDEATERAPGGPLQFGYRLDRSKPTPEIDLISPGGGVRRGIYVLKGGQLIWADTEQDGPRPKSLSSEPGSGVWLLTLRRLK
jgi:uncharacterized protein (TIGR03067 family)